jgi:hypothetical protein
LLLDYNSESLKFFAGCFCSCGALLNNRLLIFSARENRRIHNRCGFAEGAALAEFNFVTVDLNQTVTASALTPQT